MRKVLVLIFITSLTIYAVTFEKTFGGEKDDEANSIKQTSDGGYIIAGCQIDSVFDSTVYYYTSITLMKINENGEEQWRNLIPCYGTDSKGYSAKQTNDGGFILTGNAYLYGSHGVWSFIYVLKTDSSGKTLWNYIHALDSSSADTAYDIIQTEDSGYIIVGYLGFYESSVIIKLDQDGKEKWVNFDFHSIDGRSIIQTEDKGFAFTGYENTESGQSIKILKTDSLGNEVWSKNVGNMGACGYSIKKSQQGGYAVLGTTSVDIYADLAWFITLDDQGNILINKRFGNFDSMYGNYNGRSMELTSDGGYILAGYCEENDIADAWLIKTDSEGNEIWQKTYGGGGDDRIYSVIQTADGGYIMTGYTDSFGYGGTDVWVVKTDENGTEIDIPPSLPKTSELFQNYPNPFNPQTEISYSLKSEAQVTLSVFNTKGELVRTLVNEKKTAGNHTVNFKADGLNTGVYFYRLSVDGKAVQNRKMMILK